MSELKMTLTVSAVAAVLAAVAVVSAPRRAVPDAFFDVGEPFFPTFGDPEVAATLEIVQWDDAAGAALPFQVTNRDGRWTIPSHHDYPADGEERLATAAALNPTSIVERAMLAAAVPQTVVPGLK